MVIKQIRIKKGVTYEVAYIVNDDVHDGWCVKTEDDFRQIVLNIDSDRKTFIKTLIHEVLHAIENENKIKISHKAVYQLSEGIYDVLQLNGILKMVQKPKRKKKKTIA